MGGGKMNCALSTVPCDMCDERPHCPIYKQLRFLERELDRIIEEVSKRKEK